MLTFNLQNTRRGFYLSTRGISSTMTVDYISAAIGDIGKWQVIICVLMSLTKLPGGWFQFSIVVMEAEVEMWCSKPEALENMTLEEWRNISTPQHEGSQACRINNLNYTALESIEAYNESTVYCKNWDFSKDEFTNTIVTEWDLVCSRRTLVDVTQATFMFGVLLGNIIFGTLADRYGRKTPMMTTILLQATAGVAASIVPWFWAFVFFRFLTALAVGGSLIISFVVVMEVVGESWRTTMAILYQLPFTLGITTMALVAYCLRDWRHFHLTLSLLSALYLVYWWFLPESPRWLLAVGKDQEAVKILKDAARCNKLDERLVDEAVENHKKQQSSSKKTAIRRPTLFDLFKTPRMRRNSLILFFNWFAANMMLYTFTQSVNQIGGNLFVNIVLSGCVTVPGTLVCVWAMRFGRKKPIMTAMILAGVASLLIVAFPRGQYWSDWPRVALTGVALCSFAIAFPALFLFSGELFPTVVRNVGVGSAAMFGRIGAIIAPFVKSLHVYGDYWTMLIVGSAAFLCAVSVAFLPETQGCPLPDTLEDGETIEEKQKNKEDRENSNYLPLSQTAVEDIKHLR